MTQGFRVASSFIDSVFTVKVTYHYFFMVSFGSKVFVPFILRPVRLALTSINFPSPATYNRISCFLKDYTLSYDRCFSFG